MMYNKKVLDLFLNPQNVGLLHDANAIGVMQLPNGGDIVKIYLLIDDDKIVDATFKTFGNPVSIAMSSVAVTLIKGKTVDQALQLTPFDISKELGDIDDCRLESAELPILGIKKAIENYNIELEKEQKRQNKKARKTTESKKENEERVVDVEENFDAELPEKESESLTNSQQVERNEPLNPYIMATIVEEPKKESNDEYEVTMIRKVTTEKSDTTSVSNAQLNVESNNLIADKEDDNSIAITQENGSNVESKTAQTNDVTVPNSSALEQSQTNTTTTTTQQVKEEFVQKMVFTSREELEKLLRERGYKSDDSDN